MAGKLASCPGDSPARASALASAGYSEHDNARAHVLGGLLFVIVEWPRCAEAGGRTVLALTLVVALMGLLAGIAVGWYINRQL